MNSLTRFIIFVVIVKNVKKIKKDSQKKLILDILKCPFFYYSQNLLLKKLHFLHTHFIIVE